ncbi:BTB-domain-containing protein [Rhizophagus irregularis]|uniref:BTB-domain-containing protein n=1 Tax=Rhizophagus irregularis TaxID=588596 RepID=A0A2N1MH31_9GLOM|nr:BTB-domain-containing protein [Rhizophagus irregularis]
MSTQFLSKLSKNYIELLDDDEYYDITIEVGEDPNVKILRAHMSILCYRSPYLRRILASNKNRNKENILSHIKLSKISPEVFQIILKYIYGGTLSLNEQDTLEILKILIAAEELLLQELVDYLQKYFIENKSEWMEQHFELIHRTSFQSNSLLELQQFCTKFMANSPEKIFKSLDFTEPTNNISFPRNIKNDKIIDSKIVNNLSIISTISRRIDKIGNNNKFDHLRELYLPYKFRLLLRGSRDGFTPKKFHELCNNKLYTVTFIKVKGTEEILGGYNPLKWESSGGYNKAKDSFIFSFKNNNTEDVIISNIENTEYAFFNDPIIGPYFGEDLIIHSYQESKGYSQICCKKSHYEKKIRDTEDQFSIDDYEVKGTEEILGGYNPLKWESSDGYGKANDSFIFSFKNNIAKDAIISNIENPEYALYNGSNIGPYFGSDLIIYSTHDEFKDYNKRYCRKCYYEKKIRDAEGIFSLEDYEVFQITK